MDTMTKEQRRKCMQSIHSKDTRPEMVVRKFLFSHGYRYRLHVKTLPGHPDIVMRRWRTVILVNGCFWHGHTDCPMFRMPRTNVDFWKAKIERNRLRDMRDRLVLRDMGWHVITLWECQLKPKVREENLQGLLYTLNKIALDDMRHGEYQPYNFQEEDTFPMIAAEDEYGQ